MRSILDGLYRFCGLLAGLFLILIAVTILAQILFRQFGGMVPSADDFAGFSMAASAFLGLAHTLRAGAHIRVSLLLGFLPPQPRRLAEIFCLLVAIGLVGFFTWHSIGMTIESWQFDDRAPGLVPTPLWIPQTAMSFGLAVLWIAFVDDLARVVRGDLPSYETATETALEADRLGDAVEPVTPKAG